MPFNKIYTFKAAVKIPSDFSFAPIGLVGLFFCNVFNVIEGGRLIKAEKLHGFTLLPIGRSNHSFQTAWAPSSL